MYSISIIKLLIIQYQNIIKHALDNFGINYFISCTLIRLGAALGWPINIV